MRRISFVALCVVAVAVVMFSGRAEAVTCNPTELSSCAPAFTSPAPPSATCCIKLMEQKPCLCEYLKNPSLKQYVMLRNTIVG
ncbi:Tracheary Element Differentiation-related 4 [Hibiscus trionum]|uniref:Tracheary Element Differentiation-related 4 n=1 Tax=Hibiscus trionum TaxID=183268 RepID=A0A9W7LQF6_HIBTR|nr:Tracheary Element Differentiation-related 4 [Hibiscus trionum]